MARGFTKTPGTDYHNTYSSTAKLSTLRTVLECVVKQGMHFNQLDIKTAYLNAPIQEDIFMQQPEGYQKGKQIVCKLKRSLYGLKQSGRIWFEYLSSHLFELNFFFADSDEESSQVLDSGLGGCYFLLVN